jgi:DNA-binding transcriptional MerR regulator
MTMERYSRADESPPIRIGELGRRVGVRPETLRAWERRYRLLSPERSAAGYRLYSAGDEKRVREMLGWMSRGVAASEAAKLAGAPVGAAPAAERRPRADGQPALAVAMLDLIAALQRFDEEGAHRILDEAFARFSLETVLSELVLPVLAEVGDRWSRGDVSVGEEHFCTEVLRGRLLSLARGWGAGEGPLAVLSCPPGERHDLGVVVFGLALREQGWRIAFLGADTPMATLADAAERLDPELVVSAAVDPERFETAGADIRDLAGAHPLALAGAGATAETARSLGAGHLDKPPVAAAVSLAASTASNG